MNGHPTPSGKHTRLHIERGSERRKVVSGYRIYFRRNGTVDRRQPAPTLQQLADKCESHPSPTRTELMIECEQLREVLDTIRVYAAQVRDAEDGYTAHVCDKIEDIAINALSLADQAAAQRNIVGDAIKGGKP